MNTALRILSATSGILSSSMRDAAHAEALAVDASMRRLFLGPYAADTGADQFFRCTATAAECLADGRDALMDAADEQNDDALCAARYRWAIAREDNAEELYAAVLNNSPNTEDIDYEIDMAMNKAEAA